MQLKEKLTTELLKLENNLHLLGLLNKNPDSIPTNIDPASAIESISEHSLAAIQGLLHLLEEN